VTEAQQRRAFFEALLKQSRDQLAQAQKVLQTSGLSSDAIRTEPRAAAEAYARTSAEVAAAEVRLQTLRASLSEGAAEVQRQREVLTALSGQLRRLEMTQPREGGDDYIGRYRNFKYQEALFELYARQFELARVDESREGGLIQVVDPATPPEVKTSPRRARIALTAMLLAALALAVWQFLRGLRAEQSPTTTPLASDL
jgi:hypothetical protein